MRWVVESECNLLEVCEMLSTKPYSTMLLPRAPLALACQSDGSYLTANCHVWTDQTIHKEFRTISPLFFKCLCVCVLFFSPPTASGQRSQFLPTTRNVQIGSSLQIPQITTTRNLLLVAPWQLSEFILSLVPEQWPLKEKGVLSFSPIASLPTSIWPSLALIWWNWTKVWNAGLYG